MSENWTSTPGSVHLRGRRNVDTQPEVELRRAVHRAGGRYRLHPRLAKGCTPDFVLPRRHIAVFVDGCLWHQCPKHGRTEWSGPNATLWVEKMRRNKARDDHANELAESLGWHVLRVWECEVREDTQACAAAILAAGDGEP